MELFAFAVIWFLIGLAVGVALGALISVGEGR